MWILGEMLTLPSGRRVPLTTLADSDRPWTPLEVTGLWHVVRQAGPAGRSSLGFYFGEEAMPLQLDEADAIELAEALNSVMEIE